ncbi:MAG TPA: beta-ketoacyl-ACP synthase III [Phycisphaerae bacterium]|nr:beta-ketoacyl-ACP synthase III [Phycisphaerae bacterium]
MPEPLGVKIIGTGSAVPDQVLTNQYFVERLDTTHEWIMERTGILERRIASDKESTASLATAAARKALDDAHLTPADLDAILVATITPEYTFPSTACCVQRDLEAPPIPAFDLSAACSGFIYALVMGSFLVQGGQFRRILIIGAETMSRITDYEDRATCILFGDGAGAAVLEAAPDTSGPALLHHQMHAEGKGALMLCVPASGMHLTPSHMTVNERLHYIKMQGREVYKLAVKRNFELVDSVLKETGLKSEDITLVIPHQSNLRIIESARERLGLPKERVYVNIDRLGNTSAASIPMGLDECRRTGRIKSGDLVLLVAFGAGFTWASALLRL